MINLHDFYLRAVKETLLFSSEPWTKLQGSVSQSETSTDEGLGRPPSPVVNINY